MPLYTVTNGAPLEVPVDVCDGHLARLTVSSDRLLGAISVSLHSGEARAIELASGAGLVVDDVVLDPEVIEVRITPSAPGDTPVYVTVQMVPEAP